MSSGSRQAKIIQHSHGVDARWPETPMIMGTSAPFVSAFIDAVDDAIRAHQPHHGMSAMQRAWLDVLCHGGCRDQLHLLGPLCQRQPRHLFAGRLIVDVSPQQDSLHRGEHARLVRYDRGGPRRGHAAELLLGVRLAGLQHRLGDAGGDLHQGRFARRRLMAPAGSRGVDELGAALVTAFRERRAARARTAVTGSEALPHFEW